MGDDRVHKHVERALQGNLEKERDKLARQNKMFVRDRLDRLLDPGSFAEDGLLANALADSLPADGVVTGMGRIDGRPVCVMANDPTVKAGSSPISNFSGNVAVRACADRLKASSTASS